MSCGLTCANAICSPQSARFVLWVLFVWQSTLPSPFPTTRAAYTTHTGGIQSHRAPEPRVLCCVRCVCTWHYCHSKQRVYAGLFQIQFHTSTHQPHSIGPSTIWARSLSVCAPLSLTPSPWLLCVHRHTVSVQRWLTIRTYTGSILYPVICDATRTAQRIEHQQQNMCKTIKYHGRNELCVCVRTLRHVSSSNVRCLLRSHFVFLTYPSMYQRHDIHLPHTHTY